jgi:hypothetical protein
MKRWIVPMFLFVCVWLASSGTASAAPCATTFGGTLKDVYNNTLVSAVFAPVNLGDYSFFGDCIDAAYNYNSSYARGRCLNYRSGVAIDMGGVVYYNNSPVATVTAPDSCRTGYGLNDYTTLGPDESLNPGDSISFGSYQLKFQVDANLVLYNGASAIWATNCWPVCVPPSNPGVAVMQLDGNFVVYDNVWTPLWNSGTAGNSGAFLTLRNGQLLLFATNGSVLWQAP